VAFQAAAVFVGEPFGAHVFQEEVWVPGRHVSILFLITPSFIETSTNPARDAR
jgi:hypothetical protein